MHRPDEAAEPAEWPDKRPRSDGASLRPEGAWRVFEGRPIRRQESGIIRQGVRRDQAVEGVPRPSQRCEHHRVGIRLGQAQAAACHEVVPDGRGRFRQPADLGKGLQFERHGRADGEPLVFEHAAHGFRKSLHLAGVQPDNDVGVEMVSSPRTSGGGRGRPGRRGRTTGDGASGTAAIEVRPGRCEAVAPFARSRGVRPFPGRGPATGTGRFGDPMPRWPSLPRPYAR